MASSKLVALVAVAVLAVSCGPRFEWQKFPMDGHRTGVKSVTGPDFATPLGLANDTVYVAPNGKVFTEDATLRAANLLIGIQPRMAALKEVLAVSPVRMTRTRPECALGNWAADALKVGVAKVCGRTVDVAFVNIGGIRIDMPEGNVLLDDIKSMFPFKNYISYVRLKGSDLRAIFQYMAENRVDPFSGATIEIEGNTLKSVKIAGKDLDDEREYGVGTVDFMLDGGDGYKIAANAKELIISPCLMMTWMESYVRELSASGKMIESNIDGRVKICK